jgi:hypothetical protein
LSISNTRQRPHIVDHVAVPIAYAGSCQSIELRDFCKKLQDGFVKRTAKVWMVWQRQQGRSLMTPGAAGNIK